MSERGDDVGAVMGKYMEGVPCVCGHSSTVHAMGRPEKDSRAVR